MAASVRLGPSGKARYAQLADSLLAKIADGGYPVGSLMPTEFDLGVQFGVSRTTVREAIRHLSDLGLVSRKPGVGTLVRAKYAAPRFVHAIESVSDIFQYTQKSGKPVLLGSSEVEASDSEAELLQCAPGQRWIRFETLRSIAGKRTPMVLSEAYVLPAYARVVARVPTRNQPIYTLLESEYGEVIVEVQQEFRALNTNRRQASLLEVKPGSAGLNVIRHYFGRGDRLLLVTLSVYPADRFSYAMRLRYNQQPKGSA